MMGGRKGYGFRHTQHRCHGGHDIGALVIQFGMSVLSGRQPRANLLPISTKALSEFAPRLELCGPPGPKCTPVIYCSVIRIGDRHLSNIVDRGTKGHPVIQRKIRPRSTEVSCL